MTNNQNAQLFSLGEFINTIWDPTIRHPSEAEPTSPEHIMSVARSLEAVLWLILGIELRAYPDTGYLLLEQSKSDIASMLAYERELKTIIAPTQWLSLLQLTSGSKAGGDYRIEDPLACIPFFYTAIALADQMNRDVVGTAFQRALTLEREAAWQYFIQEEAHYQAVQSMLDQWETGEIKVLSTEALIAGCMRSIEAMSMWKVFFETLRNDQSITLRDRAILQRRIGHITRWRLALHEETTKARFLETAKLVCDLIAHECKVSDSNHLDKEIFMSHIGELLDRWNGDHEIPLSISA